MAKRHGQYLEKKCQYSFTFQFPLQSLMLYEVNSQCLFLNSEEKEHIIRIEDNG